MGAAVQAPETAREHLRNALQIAAGARARDKRGPAGELVIEAHELDAIERRIIAAQDVLDQIHRQSADRTGLFIRQVVRERI